MPGFKDRSTQIENNIVERSQIQVCRYPRLSLVGFSLISATSQSRQYLGLQTGEANEYGNKTK
jgi:hypothetical protein